MIITKNLIWSHLCRTGGSAIEYSIEYLYNLIHSYGYSSDLLLCKSEEGEGKHATVKNFNKAKDLIEDQYLVLSIRRLPSWILSVSNYYKEISKEEQFNYAIKGKPMHYNNGVKNPRYADDLLKGYIANYNYSNIIFIRNEYIELDFSLLVDKIINDNNIGSSDKVEIWKKVISCLREEQSTKRSYDNNLLNWYSLSQIANMYLNNPEWESLEKLEYGDTFLDVINKKYQTIQDLIEGNY